MCYKIIKRISCLLITTSILMNFFAVPFNAYAFERENDRYVYEDFSNYNGNLTEIGFKQAGSNYLATEQGGTALGINFYSSGSSVITLNGTVGKDFVFNIEPSEFEDAGKYLVFSYDAYIPDSADSRQGMYSWLQFGNDAGNASGAAQFALGSKLYYSGNKRYICAFANDALNWTKSTYLSASAYSSSISLDNVSADLSGGQWVNFKLVSHYNSEKGSYDSWNYINGCPILNADKIDVFSAVPDDERREAMRNRKSIVFNIGVRCGSDGVSGKDILFKNIGISLYGESEIPKYCNVRNGESDIELPVYNSVFADDESIADTIRMGTVDVSNAEVSGVIYNSDDAFFADGNPISGLGIQQSEDINDGSKIKISNLPKISDDEILVLSINNVTGIEGKKDYTVLVGNESAQTSFYNANAVDFFGEQITPERDENGYRLPIETKKIEFLSIDDTDKKMEVIDEDGTTVEEAAFENGTYKITFEKLLEAGKTYTIVYDKRDITKFYTSESEPTVSFEVNEEGIPEFSYMNTFSDDVDAVLVSAGYTNGVFQKAVKDEIAISAKSAGSFRSAKITDEYDSYIGFAWLKQELETPLINETKFKINPFDGNSLSNAAVCLGEENALQTVEMIAVDSEGEIVNVSRLTLNQDGNNSVALDYKDKNSDIYTFYLKCDDGIYRFDKKYITPAETEIELSKFLGLTLEEMKTYIETEGENLDLKFSYYDNVNKDKVVKNLYEYIKDSSNAKITKKEELYSLFRQFSIIEALNESQIDNISDIFEYLPYVNEEPTKKWVYESETVDKQRTQKWIEFLTKQLNNANIADIDDLSEKIAISAVFAGINDRQSVNVLKEMMDDYAEKLKLDKDLITTAILSKLNNTYSGFGLNKLKEDMESLKGSNSYTSPSGGGVGGGGTGTKKISVDSKSEILPPIDKEENADKSVFNDLVGYEWAKDAINELSQRNIVNGDGNGAFRPDSKVTREEFVKMLVNALNISSLFDKQLPFEDIAETDWAYPYVKSAYESNIVNGVASNLFGMGNEISREDLAVMICNAVDTAILGNVGAETEIKDMDMISEYAVEAVNKLVKAGILNGYEDKTFKPQNGATRAEAAKIIYAVLLLKDAK